MRALSVLVLPALVMFSMAGFRMDGLAFNQRYLLEIVPLAAIIVAICLDGLYVPTTHVVGGFLVAAFSVAILLMIPSSHIQHVAILRVQLLLGLTLVVAWIFRSRP